MSTPTVGLVKEGKRKRDPFDELMIDIFDASNDGAKRCTLGRPEDS